MQCPSLDELPRAPLNKEGWPWTEESPALPAKMDDGSPWPKISIVTPSLNQGQFIEETIRSVLLQEYPNLEYIIIDGGSTDGSVEIIKKYDKWITYWISEQDKGQSHAINKGFQRASGDVITWVNSDDIYLKGAFEKVASSFVEDPHKIIQGKGIVFDNVTKIATNVSHSDFTFESIIKYWERSAKFFVPGLFYPKALIDLVGGIDENFNYAFDIDLLCKLLIVSSVHYIDFPFALFRLHSASKTVAQPIQFQIEWSRISLKYLHHTNTEFDNAYHHITKSLTTTAIYQFREGHFKEFQEAIFESWHINRSQTIKAIFKEFLRLFLGGKYTGRTLG